MPKYRKISVVVEAFRAKDAGQIQTLEGVMSFESGDWIITGVEGEKYPCKDGIFRKTYEPVDTTAAKEMGRWR
jgi:hypothetical protein